MKCPGCYTQLPLSFGLFTEANRSVRGKNEQCPGCACVLWIALDGAVKNVSVLHQLRHSEGPLAFWQEITRPLPRYGFRPS